MSLDTLANVKTRLGITTSADDTLIGLLQDSADSWIGNYCGRDFIGGTYTEYFPGNTEFLTLANFPVTSVTSVNVDPAEVFGSNTIIDPSTYVVHSERGVIQSKVGPFVAPYRNPALVNADRAIWTRSPRAVQVIYSTATGNVPNDVKEAYAQIINHWYCQVKTQVAAGFQNLSELKLDDMTYRFDQLAHLPIPPEIERLLAPYRTANI
ncbi:MAG TPA: phage head-tail connector protein [Gemmataceae bacterium]|nr:phage head-tail connector protein [Gemmataceae bacterium]